MIVLLNTLRKREIHFSPSNLQAVSIQTDFFKTKFLNSRTKTIKTQTTLCQSICSLKVAR